MRRKDKEITERQTMEEMIKRAKVCRLGLSHNNRPYIIPLCFGYAENTLYFHSAPEGEKLGIMRQNPAACFEIDLDVDEVKGDMPCNWSMRYQSIVGFGEVRFIEDLTAKKKALAQIISHYTEDSSELPEEAVAGLAVFELKIESMSGKKSRIQ